MFNFFVKYRQKLDEHKLLKAKLNSAFATYKQTPTPKTSRALIEAILKLDENVEFFTNHEKVDK